MKKVSDTQLEMMAEYARQARDENLLSVTSELLAARKVAEELREAIGPYRDAETDLVALWRPPAAALEAYDALFDEPSLRERCIAEVGYEDDGHTQDIINWTLEEAAKVAEVRVVSGYAHEHARAIATAIRKLKEEA